MQSESTDNGPSSFRDLIDILGGSAVISSAIGEPYPTVASWKNRDNIPSGRWSKIIGLADEQGVTGITYEVLGRLASDKQAVA